MVEGAAGQVAGCGLAMDAQGIDPLGQPVVVGQHRPAVAVAAEGLGREEAGGGHVRPVAGVFGVEGAAEALGAVADQLQVMAPRDPGDGRIVRRLAEEVDGDDHLGDQLALGLDGEDRGLQGVGVHVVGVGQYVDEHRRGADQGDHLPGGREGEAGAKHRVPRANAPGHQRQQQGVGAVGA